MGRLFTTLKAKASYLGYCQQCQAVMQQHLQICAATFFPGYSFLQLLAI